MDRGGEYRYEGPGSFFCSVLVGRFFFRELRMQYVPCHPSIHQPPVQLSISSICQSFRFETSYIPTLLRLYLGLYLGLFLHSNRSLLGLPGGMNHPLYTAVQEAGEAKGLKLVEGKGNEPDTLGKKIVYVYDTAKFPFYQAEVYHQFHDDFQTPPYGRKYNRLADLLYEDGRMKPTGCPDRV